MCRLNSLQFQLFNSNVCTHVKVQYLNARCRCHVALKCEIHHVPIEKMRERRSRYGGAPEDINIEEGPTAHELADLVFEHGNPEDNVHCIHKHPSNGCVFVGDV